MNFDRVFPWWDILDWYKNNGRTYLPWRNYTQLENSQKQLLKTIWISEILLQQTQAERVVGYLEKIEQAFPTLEDLAKTSYEKFFPYYQWLGYYSRARNLLKTAKLVVEQYDGIFPNDENLLRKLPWVWPYTARAIQAFWYKIPTLAWDTNLEKVFSRYFYGDKDQKLQKEEKSEIEHSLQLFLSWKESNIVRDINNALMDYARLVEKDYPGKWNWDQYPLRQSKFYELRGENEKLEKKTKKYFPLPDAQIIVILHENHREYYSTDDTIYKPFILNANGTSESRKYVQSYFKERYNIDVSVRPIHKKWMDENTTPSIAVYAQIQSWELKNKKFPKNQIRDSLEKYKKDDTQSS